MASTTRIITVIFSILAVLYIYYWVVYKHPSDAMIAYVQLISGTNPAPHDKNDTSAATSTAAAETFETKRFTAKLHMVFPWQLWVDYPLAHAIVYDWGLRKVPMISANVVSLLHPLFGIAAGVLIANAIRAVAPSDGSSQSAPHTPSDGTAPAPKESSSHVIGVDSCTDLTTATSPTTLLSRTPHLKSTATDDEKGKREASRLQCAVDLRRLRIAFVFLFIRGVLDCIDGVLARDQRRRALAVGLNHADATSQISSSNVSYGLNGHTLDVVTDLFGVLAAGIGVLFHLWRRGVVVTSPFTIILHHVCRLRMGLQNLVLARVIAVWAFVFLSCTTGIWEHFMMLHSSLFDMHANRNAEIFALENDSRVKLNQYFWALTCGDSFLIALMLSLLVNRFWEVFQFYAIIGPLWVFLVVIPHSFYVWHFVVMANPAAAAIFKASNPTA